MTVVPGHRGSFGCSWGSSRSSWCGSPCTRCRTCSTSCRRWSWSVWSGSSPGGSRWEAGAAGPVSEQNRGVVQMWQSLKRWWKYLGVKLRVVHEERADPKVQLEQAILEARAEHRRLSDAAALVVAQQKQAQDRLDTKVEECERAKASAGQALLM